MEKFHFQLDRVLDYKNLVLDGLVGEHAGIKAEINEQERILSALRDEYAECCRNMNHAQSEGTSVMNIYVYENYLEVLGCRLKKQSQMLELLYKQEEIKSGQVIEAKKDSITMEKLKEKKKEEYRKAFVKSEEKELEEFILSARQRRA